MTELSSTEFVEWVAFLEIEEDRTGKLDWYLAQISAQFPRYLGDPKKAQRVKDEDYLVTFGNGKKNLKRYSDDTSNEQRLKLSKAAWCGIAGVNRNGG